jgi:hypothetical protein
MEEKSYTISFTDSYGDTGMMQNLDALSVQTIVQLITDKPYSTNLQADRGTICAVDLVSFQVTVQD